MIASQNLRFSHYFESIESNESIVHIGVDFEVTLHYAGETFTGISLYSTPHDSSTRLAVTRTAIGKRDDVDIERSGYEVTTIYSLDPRESTQAAIEHHLLSWSSAGSSSGNLLDVFHKNNFMDDVVLPVSTVLQALTFDPDCLNELDGSKNIQWIPYWQIQLGFGPMNRERNEYFQRGKYIGDVFVSRDQDTIDAIRRQIRQSRR